MEKTQEELESSKPLYNPKEEQKATIQRIYNEFSDMRDVMNRRYKYFNDRTLKEFIDDSEKRFNSYVPSRASQGKEDWQANFFHPTTRNKVIAILASLALDVPKIRITARNERNMLNAKISKTVWDLVKGSYDKENKEEEAFFQALEGAVKGTVITCESYLKTKVKQKVITSYDVVTGDIEYEEKDVIIDKGCQDFTIPLTDFFVSSAFIRDIQKQPAVIWVQRMEAEDFQMEFGGYKDFKFVKTSNELVSKDLQDAYFFENWNQRTKKRPYEVVRYYNKSKDSHIIIANGVILFDGPLLLGKKEKYYPFSKGGYCPFADKFFWMNSLPNSMMGEQDVINSLYAMAVDKTYKSLVNNLIIGNVNKDDFDLEDPEISVDTKVYVQDINQVKEMPRAGVTQSEFKMIELISRGLDLTSVDNSQSGVSTGGRTAREVVIANENARKLKGIFFLFITSLWLQKTKLRMLNILTYYTMKNIKSAVGDEKAQNFKKFIVDNVEMSDGKMGKKGIIIAQTKEDLPTQVEIDKNVEEYKKLNNDENYEEVGIVASYLTSWDYELKVVADSVYQNDSSYSISKNEDKLKTIVTLFPDVFEKNRKKLFEDTIRSYDEDIDDYDLEEQAPPVTQDATQENIPPEGVVPNEQNSQPIDLSNLPPTMK